MSKGTPKRLVLGFDAGCMSCSDLAKRIEGQVGDRLEIRGLHDPQVAHWRLEAIGENASWVPTLIEVDNEKVRAWTGVRMGAHLTRALGPAATWRVMKELGDFNRDHVRSEPSASTADATGTLSRGQFLKGISGAAVAFSVLSGTGALASTADAQQISSGTAAQRSRAKQIARSSDQYKSLARYSEQAFDLENVQIGFAEGGDFAAVGMSTVDMGNAGALSATFLINMRRNEVFSYQCIEGVRDEMGRKRGTLYEDGESKTSLIIGDDYAITPDNRRISKKQLQQEAVRAERATTGAFQTQSACSDCRRNTRRACQVAAVFGCAGLGPYGIPCGILVLNAGWQGAGCKSVATDWCVFKSPNTPCR